MKAIANVDFNLSFFPPSARFATSLSGFTAHFNGAGSSVGDVSRHIAQWKWTFGDGTHKVTTTSHVSHTYPKTPRSAPTYTVKLQVVDSGGAEPFVVFAVPVARWSDGTQDSITMHDGTMREPRDGRTSRQDWLQTIESDLKK